MQLMGCKGANISKKLERFFQKTIALFWNIYQVDTKEHVIILMKRVVFFIVISNEVSLKTT